MAKLYVFIDNGTSGTIGAYDGSFQDFVPTPIKMEQNYTKKKENISRIDHVAFVKYLQKLIEVAGDKNNIIVVMERPMVNPTRFRASTCALRAFEATLLLLEQMEIPHAFCDSKDWQKGTLPSSGKKGTTSADLKKESMDFGLRQFPQFSEFIKKHKDADGIVGAYSFYKQKLF